MAVVRDYYAAVAAKDYAHAYSSWRHDGAASGQSFEDFRHGYEQTATVRAEVGPAGRIEGAAGSRYVRIPVTVRARTTVGEEQCFRGTYVLRRTVIEGSTPEQRRWGLYDADLSPCR